MLSLSDLALTFKDVIGSMYKALALASTVKFEDGLLHIHPSSAGRITEFDVEIANIGGNISLSINLLSTNSILPNDQHLSLSDKQANIKLEVEIIEGKVQLKFTSR